MNHHFASPVKVYVFGEFDSPTWPPERVEKMSDLPSHADAVILSPQDAVRAARNGAIQQHRIAVGDQSVTLWAAAPTHYGRMGLDIDGVIIPIPRFRPTSPRFCPAAEVAAEIEAALSNEDDKKQNALDNQAIALVQAASRINAEGRGDGPDVIWSINITQQYRDALLSGSGPQRLAYKFGMDVLIYHGYVLRPEDVDDQGQPRGEDLTRAVRVPDVLARHFGF